MYIYIITYAKCNLLYEFTYVVYTYYVHCMVCVPFLYNFTTEERYNNKPTVAMVTYAYLFNRVYFEVLTYAYAQITYTRIYVRVRCFYVKLRTYLTERCTCIYMEDTCEILPL